MMYIYWEEIGRGHMRKILDNESWELYCDCDEQGLDCLTLRIGVDTYCVCDSFEWMQDNPKLYSYHLEDYFTEVAKTVYEIIIKYDSEYIDLAKIQKQVLEPFWEKWKKEGYVED